MTAARRNEDFARRYGPWALIAGGSEGIGLSFARLLAARGLNLVLLARRAPPLEEAAGAIRAEFGIEVQTRALDLTAHGLDAEIEALTSGREVGLLVCNAGATHGAALLLDRPVEAALKLVELNCTAPLRLVHRLGSRMKARGRGGVILVSSLSGLAGGAYIAAYSASKAFEMVLAEALWHEFGAVGVDVLGIVPGATATPAMERSGMKFGSREQDAARASGGPRTSTVAMDPDEVAREALEHLGRGPIHVPGEANRSSADALRNAPRAQVVEAMSAAVAQMYGVTPLPIRRR